MANTYTDKDYQYYTQKLLLNLSPTSKESLAQKLLNFNINNLDTKNKADFYTNLSTFKMPTETNRTNGFSNAEARKQYCTNFTKAGNKYNSAVQQKIKEINDSGLPDVPDIELDLNDEKTIPLGINKVSTEDNMEELTMGGKQRKVSCGCSKRGGRPRSKSKRSKSRSKSRTRSKSKQRTKSKTKK